MTVLKSGLRLITHPKAQRSFVSYRPNGPLEESLPLSEFPANAST